MTRCSMLLVAALSVVLVPALMAQDHGGGHGGKPPTGKIKSVDAAAKTVTVTVGKEADAKDVVYTVTDTTKITVDKNDAKLDDVKAGMIAWITADDKNVASEIKAKTPHAPKSDK